MNSDGTATRVRDPVQRGQNYAWVIRQQRRAGRDPPGQAAELKVSVSSELGWRPGQDRLTLRRDSAAYRQAQTETALAVSKSSLPSSRPPSECAEQTMQI